MMSRDFTDLVTKVYRGNKRSTESNPLQKTSAAVSSSRRRLRASFSSAQLIDNNVKTWH